MNCQRPLEVGLDRLKNWYQTVAIEIPQIAGEIARVLEKLDLLIGSYDLQVWIS